MQSYIDAARRLDLAAYRRGVTPPELTLSDGRDLFVSYAPFDHIARKADTAFYVIFTFINRAGNDFSKISFVAVNPFTAIFPDKRIITHVTLITVAECVAGRIIENHCIVAFHRAKSGKAIIGSFHPFNI